MGAAQVAVGDPRMPDNLLAKRPRVRGAGHVVLNGAQSLGKRPQRRLELFHTRREAVDLGCLLLDLRLQRPVAFKMGGSLSCRTADGSAPENAQARIPQMDWFPADLLEPFVKGIQRLAQQEASSFCFHPLHPP